MIVKLFMILLFAGQILFSQGAINYRLGKQYYNSGEYDLALTELHRVVTAYPDHYNAHLTIGEIYVAEGEYDLAEQSVKKALRHNPNWSTAYELLGSIYEEQGSIDQAIQAYEGALGGADSLQKEQIEDAIDRLSGRRTVSEGELEEPAEDTVAEKLPRSEEISVDRRDIPAQAQEKLEKAIDLYRRGVREDSRSDLEESLQYIRRAIALHPGYPAAYYYGGVIRRRFGQNDMARVNFERALQDPDMGYNAHFYLGRIHGDMENYDTAIDHLQSYISLTDYAPGIRQARAHIEEYEEARQDRSRREDKERQSVFRDPLDDEIRRVPPQRSLPQYFLRIDSLLAMVVVDTLTDEGQAMLRGYRAYHDDKLDTSIEAFYETLDEHASGQVAEYSLFNIGIGRMLLRDWAEAARVFRDYRNRFPQGELLEKASFLEALATYEMGDFEQSRTLFTNHVRSFSEGSFEGKSQEKIGDIYRRLDEPADARTAYRKAVQHAVGTHDTVHALYKKGYLLETMKNSEQARHFYGKAIAAADAGGISERVPHSLYRMADLYYDAENLEQAKLAYTRGVREFPEYPDTPWGYFQLGNIALKRQEYEKAIELYERVMRDFPDDYWSEQAEWRKRNAIWEYQYGR
ncbi:tetratricopeptide repeat protein [Chitinivibrio alkaliphilus]|uniref:Tetratricopeptide repeat protein 21A/21B C-terminal ARM domain-containing protein n=1 Tax=Chitinivibrio alkaliphilus ACht1 TaxID=1313304 RepID=U7DA18_9BACT|nr:tetratricopeptide repeat protein [Chitinivibrio alkaliphilus]ERP38842.1 hypothetical protein CALK_0615 [Chitinivibrio alkaliphilus ACht1]